MDKALSAGIYTLGLTVTGLSSTNFSYLEEKHSKTGNYCVFFGVINPFSWDSAAQFEVDFVQFSFRGTNLSTLETLVNNFKAVFDFAKSSLTVSGYSVISCTRVNTKPATPFGDTYQIILEYRIETQKARS